MRASQQAPFTLLHATIFDWYETKRCLPMGGNATHLFHVHILCLHPHWHLPVKAVQEVGQCELHSGHCHGYSRTDPSASPKRQQLKMLPFEIDVTVLKPLWVKLIWVLPAIGVSSNCKCINQDCCLWEDVVCAAIGIDLTVLPCPVWNQQRCCWMHSKSFLDHHLQVFQLSKIVSVHFWLTSNTAPDLSLYLLHHSGVCHELRHRPHHCHCTSVCSTNKCILKKQFRCENQLKRNENRGARKQNWFPTQSNNDN